MPLKLHETAFNRKPFNNLIEAMKFKFPRMSKEMRTTKRLRQRRRNIFPCKSETL